MKSFTLALLFPLLASALEVINLPRTVSNSSMELTKEEIDSIATTSFDPRTDTVLFEFTPRLMAFSNDGEYAFDSERVKGKRGKVDLKKKSDGTWEIMKRKFGQMVRTVKRSSSSSMEFTWYSGSDLDNPACQSQSSWNPSDSSFIFATDSSSSFTKCGEFVKICTSKSMKKCTWVRRWDDCVACKKNHFDLSPAAFEKLGSLNQGVLTNMYAVTSTSKPFSKWSSKYEKMYGPQYQ